MRLSSWTLVPILAATLALGACGGGGGGSSGSSSFAGPAARNATVSVLLTVMEPPSKVARSREIDKPSPVPP